MRTLQPKPAAVEMQNICKTFFGFCANECVDFVAPAGRVHALLGENGAGKTTLMNILTGIYRPDSGIIKLHGEITTIRSPKDAIAAGIGMVHQHFRLVKTLTVSENIVLGQYNRYFVNFKQLTKQIEEISERFNLSVSPDSVIYDLSVGDQQKVEIIKALYRGADILILDEPTAVLNPFEAQRLFVILREMVQDGKTVIFISHKLGEVLEISDRITIMRRGKVIDTISSNDASAEQLASLMIEIEPKSLMNCEKENKREYSKKLIEVRNITAIQDANIGCSLNNISFGLTMGQIFGIAGVSGNGQMELAEVLIGLKRTNKGSIIIDNIEVTNKSPKDIIEKSVGFIPADRLGEGALPGLGAVDNFLLKNYFRKRYRNSFLIDLEEARNDTNQIVELYNIKIADLDYPVKFLSGGNLQRLIIGRELSQNPKILIAVNPTRGLDISGVRMIHQILLEQRSKGVGIILFSEDLEELLLLCDQLAVMFRGQLSDAYDCKNLEIETIAALMGGIGFSATEVQCHKG